MTTSNKVWHKSWKLPSVRATVDTVCGQLLEAVRERDFGEEEIFGIHLALEEALVNAIQHGNQGDAAKFVSVESLITPEKIDLSITDEGTGFNPEGLPDPRCEKNLYKCSGRGVLLIRAYMDVVEYNDRGNCIHMVKYRTSA